MIQRWYDNLEKYIEPGKALIMYGPRRAGKTTLVKKYLETTPWKYKWDSGDNIKTREVLGSEDFKKILEYASGYQLLVIDEAQQISGIGMGLKILVDNLPELRILVTGSSSFELANQVGEPLVGRKNVLNLFPVAQMELKKQLNNFELKEQLEDFLVFGSYPEILELKTRAEKIRALEDLVSSYLYKDILAFDSLRNPQVLQNIVKMLAWQVGSQVSNHEIARAVGVDAKTVGRYLDLLEKTFVIFKLGGYSKNLRSEITRKQKYYFYDLGVRNAVIFQYNNLDTRNDIGQLWENFVVVERMKRRVYTGLYGGAYYWRTYSGAEIDLIEERDGRLFGLECKWKEEKKNPSPDWIKAYPGSEFTVVSQENYLEMVG